MKYNSKESYKIWTDFCIEGINFLFICKVLEIQTMTEAEHNRPIPKLFDNRPSASDAEVFCETIRLVIYIRCGHVVRDFESEAKTR